jgi:hypothetical protein
MPLPVLKIRRTVERRRNCVLAGEVLTNGATVLPLDILQ